MDNETILKKIEEVTNELNLKESNFYLYAVKIENHKDSENPLTSLNYNFYDSQLKKDDIKKSLDVILNYTKKR